MKFLPVVSLFLLSWSGTTFADQDGSAVTVKVFEGNDAILPCSLSTTENIESKLFDWKKDGGMKADKQVFLYDAGSHYNNGRPGQDEQFKGRVSHFEDELKYGNASIKITKMKLSDSGDYTCVFPRLQPERRFLIQLVVGAAPKPSVKTLDQTEDSALLQCEVHGASPKPKVEWWDSSGNIVPAEEPKVSERGGSYDIILNATVTKTDRYRCVVTQEESYHQTNADTFVRINEPILKDRSEENIPGASPEPSVTILAETKDWALLQCKVRGASPEPKVEWKDRSGNIVPAEEPQVSERGGSYDVILQATVTKTDNYSCVATQKKIYHQTHAEIYVLINGAVVVVGEGNDVILPCSPSTKENIELKAFTWITDGQKQVFSYNAGIHSNNGRPGQVEQFKGRVSYFPGELKNGDASIKITNTMAADSGDYSCVFPHLQSETRHVQLVVRPLVVRVVEGSDVILPCSFSTENIKSKLFDWKKDSRKEVFLYDEGDRYNNGHPGQDEQFKGRVSHFPDKLRNGNASIKITKTKLSDGGNYTCVFPRLQPERRFLIQLVVEPILKDRSEENIPGAAPEPSVTILDQTKDWALLQCKVQVAFPEPKVELKDRSGNIVPAEEPQVSERGDIILQATVTKTDRYRCVSTQEEIYHQTHAEIYVLINGEAAAMKGSTGWIGWVVVDAVLAVLLLGGILAVLYGKGVIPLNCNKGSPVV